MTNHIILDSFLDLLHLFAVSNLEKERVVEREAQLFLKKEFKHKFSKNKKYSGYSSTFS